LPNTLTELSDNLFGSSTLYSIIIPDSVLTLGIFCFSYCSNLNSITLGSNLTTFGDGCFNYSSLSLITIPSSVITIGNNVFTGCGSLLTITIPSSVLSLGDECFSQCSFLTNITFNEGLTTIGKQCFQNCNSLITVNLPSSLTTINDNCFNSCINLNTITIKQNVTSFGNNCFFSCSFGMVLSFVNPSIITTSASLITNVSVIFYSTPSAPNPPASPTGVYDTSLYSGSRTTFTYISASCYTKNTLILALINNVEQYVKIKDLKKGDLIKTYIHGYKPIKIIGQSVMLNDVNNFASCLYEYDGLIITGGHSMLVDKIDDKPKVLPRWYNKKQMIDDKYLLLCADDNRFTKINNNNSYEIYHFVIDGDNKKYGVYVNNGLLSESTLYEEFIERNFKEI
jgi:hypothetical protein